MVLNRLTELRKSKRWSLQYIADRLGIAKSTYAGYESGYREPSLEAVKMLAELFETSIDYLLGRVDDPDPQHPGTNHENPLPALTELGTVPLSVDGIALSTHEVKQLIAFVRAVREIGGE